MNRQWFGVFVVAGFTATAVLGAQGNQSPANTPPADAAAPPGIQRTQQPPAPAAQPKGNTVTLSGCIQDAPMATAAAKPAEPAGATKTFYLNNATMADAGRDKAAVGTSGLSSTGYRLDGEEKELSPHMNHQVRIVGTVQGSGAPGAPTTLKVDSVTMVSAKCEPASK